MSQNENSTDIPTENMTQNIDQKNQIWKETKCFISQVSLYLDKGCKGSVVVKLSDKNSTAVC